LTSNSKIIRTAVFLTPEKSAAKSATGRAMKVMNNSE